MADFEEMFCSARRVECARELNPRLQSFSPWLAQNAKRIPIQPRVGARA
jgi:hypothetical protein